MQTATPPALASVAFAAQSGALTGALLRIGQPDPRAAALRSDQARRDRDDDERDEQRRRRGRPTDGVDGRDAARTDAARRDSIRDGERASRRADAADSAAQRRAERRDDLREASGNAFRRDLSEAAEHKSPRGEPAPAKSAPPLGIPSQSNAPAGAIAGRQSSTDGSAQRAQLSGAPAPAGSAPPSAGGAASAPAAAIARPANSQPAAQVAATQPAATASLAPSATTRPPGGPAGGAAIAAGATARVDASASASHSALEVVPRASDAARAIGAGRGAARADAAAAGPDSTRSDDANVERILRLIRGRIDERGGSATMRLDPPEIGSVRLHIELRDDAVSLRMDTSSELAHRMLREQLDGLRQRMEQSGLRLEQVEIRPPQPAAPGDGRSDGAAGKHAGTDAGRPPNDGWFSDSGASHGREHRSSEDVERQGSPLDPHTDVQSTSATAGREAVPERPGATPRVNVLA